MPITQTKLTKAQIKQVKDRVKNVKKASKEVVASEQKSASDWIRAIASTYENHQADEVPEFILVLYAQRNLLVSRLDKIQKNRESEQSKQSRRSRNQRR